MPTTVGEELSPEVETIYLRSDTEFDRATFSWSLDGDIWKQTAHTYQLTFGSWRGNRPGLFCWNARTDEPAEAGWVDWFEIHHFFLSDVTSSTLTAEQGIEE